MGKADPAGHGSWGRGGGCRVVDGGSERRNFEANVSGREVVASSVGSMIVGVAGAGVGSFVENGLEAVEVEENGFAGTLPEQFAEKGFEKGFALGVLPEPLDMPKSDSPILGCGFSSCLTSFFSGFAAVLALAPFAIRTLLIPLTLPSFRLHVLRRQLHMYIRRSWPGNCSGMSPLSSSKRLRSPLHTLHFASTPLGTVLSSSQAYVIHQQSHPVKDVRNVLIRVCLQCVRLSLQWHLWSHSQGEHSSPCSSRHRPKSHYHTPS